MPNHDQQLETIEAVESLAWNSDTEYDRHRDQYLFYKTLDDWLTRDYDLMREEQTNEC